MEISHKRLNRVDLLAINGRLDAASAPQLKQQIDALLDDGRCRLVLDLAGLEYVASPGLRVLIEARKNARGRKLTDLEGGDVRIANLPPRIKEVFDLTGFTSLFEIYPDTTEPVGSFCILQSASLHYGVDHRSRHARLAGEDQRLYHRRDYARRAG
jgi:anti-sigma B factor antagonist